MDNAAVDDLKTRVSAWLNKSGFPLEMRVAQAFKDRLASSREWDVETNVSYEDPETGLTRERDLVADTSIDIFAERGVGVSIELFVECKSTSSPWVVLKEEFDDPGKRRPLFRAYGHTSANLRLQQRDGQLSEFCKTLDKYLAGRIPVVPNPGYGVAEAFKKSNESDVPYAATQQVLSSMNYTRSDYYGGSDGRLNIVFFFPVVITTSPLFEATLDRATGEVVTQQVSRTAVLVSHRKALETPVSLVNDTAIDSLLNDLQPLHSEINNFLDIYDRRILNEEEGAGFSIGNW